MVIDWSTVKAVTIPEGECKRVAVDGVVIWERGGLPSTYQQVEYIESSGTQWIDTGITLTKGCIITLSVNVERTTANATIYGWRWSGTYRDKYHLYVKTDGGNRSIYAGIPYTTSIDNCYDFGTDTTIVFDSESSRLTVNGVTATWSYNYNNAFNSDGSSVCHPYLFALNDIGGKVPCARVVKLYDYVVTLHGAEVQHLVPCYRIADGEIGMYDLVNGVFYTNQGSGTFIKGEDV